MRHTSFLASAMHASIFGLARNAKKSSNHDNERREVNILISTTMGKHGLSDEEVEDLKEAFNMFDVDGGGSISKDELKGVMKKLGQNPTDDDIEAMIKSVDDNGDGEIDFDEFLVLMSAKKKKGDEDPDKELKDAFKVFDADGSGTISRSELKKLMKSLGQKLSDAELDAMMDEVDTDKSGEIDFSEFKAMMSN